MGTHAQRRATPWWVLATIAAVVVAVVAVVVIQLRASAAEQARADAEQARVEAAEAERLEAERLAEQQAAARAADRAAQAGTVDAAVQRAWTSAGETAARRLEDADDLLAEADGEVDDEATREAVTDAVAALTEALQVDEPGPADVAAVSAAGAVLDDATAALADAHEEWLAAEAAAKAEQEAAARAPGYGGDCGGAGSYEASTPSPNGLYTSVPGESGDGSNGNMPRSAMTPLGWCVDSLGHQQWLRSDAAAAMVRLNEAFRAEFGENIAIDLSYRSYADQVHARELYGGLAAAPGTSNHGWGTAIDTWEWAAYDFGSARHEWLVARGPAYGWHCPAATESGNPEYWHFEYRG